MNLLLATDYYKHSHHLQLPPNTKFVSSYIEARSGGDSNQVSLFFGLQAYLARYLAAPITREDIREADECMRARKLPFNREGWEYILREHSGYMPIEIQALPEGTLVKRGTPMVQLRNTDPKCAWLTSFLETALLRAIWYPTSVATMSFLVKAIIYEGLVQSSDDPDGQIPFKLHDMGARGVSSSESAGLGAMAHLLNFRGTDTLEGVIAARQYYRSGWDIWDSVPASEHSTMTAWGPKGEYNAYANMIEQFGDGLFSVVSDSYDLWNAVDEIFGEQLRGQISGIKGVLVVRPDSGDPILTPLMVLEKLWAKFGGTVNRKGYRVLDPKVRVIQGDGMDSIAVAQLVAAILPAGFSLDNIVFGMGGKLLQGHMRDDMRFAMKANATDFGDGWLNVQKKPATDPTKASKAGRQAVVWEGDDLVAVREDELGDRVNALETVYLDGDVKRWTSWSSVQQRAHAELQDFHRRVFGAERQAA